MRCRVNIPKANETYGMLLKVGSMSGHLTLGNITNSHCVLRLVQATAGKCHFELLLVDCCNVMPGPW